MIDAEVFDLATLAAARAEVGRSYLEFLRVPALNVGIYELPAGAEDLQRPHDEDEIYYVERGRARFSAGDEIRDIGPGSVIYVRRGLEHSFVDVASDLRLLVIFAS